MSEYARGRGPRPFYGNSVGEPRSAEFYGATPQPEAAPKMRLSALMTPEILARLGAERSGMANAASMVGAGAPDNSAARALAQRAAQQSGVADAAASVGAAPSRGQAIRARLAELRSAGLSGMEAMRQAAKEGLLPASALRALTAVPGAVQRARALEVGTPTGGGLAVGEPQIDQGGWAIGPVAQR